MSYHGGTDILEYDTLLRYHLHMDPRDLSDEEWAYTLKLLYEIKKAEHRRSHQHRAP